MFVITGATGRTGRVVAETLLAAGERVRVIVRDEAKGGAWRARGADVRVARLEDEAALTAALAGAKGLYALLPEEPAVADFRAHRRRMADAIARAVRAAGVPHVVFLSAVAASLAEGNGPAEQLHYAENALRDSGAKITAIRACYFQDNVIGMACPARQAGIYPSFLPSADIALPTVAARDVGRLAARCLVEPPEQSEVIDVGGPMYSVRDMAAALARAIESPVRVVEIPPEAHVETLVREAHLPRPYAESLAEMFACLASGRVRPEGDRAERGATELEEVLSAAHIHEGQQPLQRMS